MNVEWLIIMAMKRDPVVDTRIFNNVYVCMRCNAKLRTSKPVERTGAKCRKCGYKGMRLKRKHIKKVAA